MVKGVGGQGTGQGLFRTLADKWKARKANKGLKGREVQTAQGKERTKRLSQERLGQKPAPKSLAKRAIGKLAKAGRNIKRAARSLTAKGRQINKEEKTTKRQAEAIAMAQSYAAEEGLGKQIQADTIAFTDRITQQQATPIPTFAEQFVESDFPPVAKETITASQTLKELLSNDSMLGPGQLKLIDALSTQLATTQKLAKDDLTPDEVHLLKKGLDKLQAMKVAFTEVRGMLPEDPDQSKPHESLNQVSQALSSDEYSTFCSECQGLVGIAKELGQLLTKHIGEGAPNRTTFIQELNRSTDDQQIQKRFKAPGEITAFAMTNLTRVLIHFRDNVCKNLSEENQRKVGQAPIDVLQANVDKTNEVRRAADAVA